MRPEKTLPIVLTANHPTNHNSEPSVATGGFVWISVSQVNCSTLSLIIWIWPGRIKCKSQTQPVVLTDFIIQLMRQIEHQASLAFSTICSTVLWLSTIIFRYGIPYVDWKSGYSSMLMVLVKLVFTSSSETVRLISSAIACRTR